MLQTCSLELLIGMQWDSSFLLHTCDCSSSYFLCLTTNAPVFLFGVCVSCPLWPRPVTTDGRPHQDCFCWRFHPAGGSFPPNASSVREMKNDLILFSLMSNILGLSEKLSILDHNVWSILCLLFVLKQNIFRSSIILFILAFYQLFYPSFWHSVVYSSIL